jgi:hypothetical protein
LCDDRTAAEFLVRLLFGGRVSDWYKIRQIKKGDILFLLNYRRSPLHGVFEAVSDGRMNPSGKGNLMTGGCGDGS